MHPKMHPKYVVFYYRFTLLAQPLQFTKCEMKNVVKQVECKEWSKKSCKPFYSKVFVLLLYNDNKSHFLNVGVQ